MAFAGLTGPGSGWSTSILSTLVRGCEAGELGGAAALMLGLQVSDAPAASRTVSVGGAVPCKAERIGIAGLGSLDAGPGDTQRCEGLARHLLWKRWLQFGHWSYWDFPLNGISQTKHLIWEFRFSRWFDTTLRTRLLNLFMSKDFEADIELNIFERTLSRNQTFALMVSFRTELPWT